MHITSTILLERGKGSRLRSNSETAPEVIGLSSTQLISNLIRFSGAIYFNVETERTTTHAVFESNAVQCQHFGFNSTFALLKSVFRYDWVSTNATKIPPKISKS